MFFDQGSRFWGKEIPLINERLTFDEIAAQLSEVLGTEIKVKYRTEEETAEAKKTFPLPVEYQLFEPYLERNRVHDALAKYGFRLTTFKEFLQRERSAAREFIGLKP